MVEESNSVADDKYYKMNFFTKMVEKKIYIYILESSLSASLKKYYINKQMGGRDLESCQAQRNFQIQYISEAIPLTFCNYYQRGQL